MKMQQIFIVTISLLVFGCASTKMTEAEKQQLIEDIKSYNSEVMAPVMFLNYMYCLKYNETKQWPTIPSQNGANSPFLSITEKSNTSLKKFEFKLKSSKLLWNLEAKLKDQNGVQYCESMVTAGHGGINLRFSGPIQTANTKQMDHQSYKEFEESILPLTRSYYPFLKFSEDTRPQMSSQKHSAFQIFMSDVVVKSTICALLDVEPALCT